MIDLRVRNFGVVDYLSVYADMLATTLNRTSASPDELWLLQHPAVFTQGQAGKAEHIFHTGSIPVIQTDRGGQVTYHGPGQLVVYVLVDIKRAALGARQLVGTLERALVSTLAHWQIQSHARADAPGVYVGARKIASLGLRIKHGCSFHGLALNIDMDLTPFSYINPCGYAGLSMTQMRDETSMPVTIAAVARTLEQQLRAELKACGAGYE